MSYEKTALRRSERIYDLLLKFYPKSYRQEFGEEMKYIFSRLLKDAYTENKEEGVKHIWKRTIIDAGKSLVVQHIENQKGGDSMKSKNIIRIMLITAVILLIPLLAKWPWSLTDFIIIGVLLLGTGIIYELLVKRIRNTNHRVILGLALLAALGLIWVELAVGFFGTPFAGS